MSSLHQYVPINANRQDIKICYAKPISEGHEVFLGRIQDPLRNREIEVAIKRIRPLERNKEEMNIMLTLPQHNNTVRYIENLEGDFGPPAWHLVTELCQESNLHALVKQSNFTFETKRVILLQIARGLAHLHSNNVVHRDLKPHNVLLSMDGRYIKICDFGLSKLVSDAEDSVTKTCTIIGTLGWGSPESYLKKRKISAKSDVFSAGLLYFFVMTDGGHMCGKNPDDRTSRIKDEKELDITGLSLEDNVFEELLMKQLIEEMVVKDPGQRPTSEEVLQHPFFWNAETSADFLYFVAENLERIAPPLSGFFEEVSLSSSWKDSLQHNGENRKLSQFFLEYVLEIERQTEQAHIHDFLKLFHDRYGQIKLGSDRPDFTSNNLWQFFVRRYPKPIYDIFSWVLKNVKKDIIIEDFRAIDEYPRYRRLIPVVQDVRCRHVGHEIGVDWEHTGEEEVSYQIEVIADGELVLTRQTLEKKLIMKDLKPSKPYVFKVFAQNNDGVRSPPVKSSTIYSLPSQPRDVTVCSEGTNIVVKWITDDDDDSTFWVNVVEDDNNGGIQEYKMKGSNGRLQIAPKPSTEYTFCVYGINSDEQKGDGSYPRIHHKTLPGKILQLEAMYIPQAESFKISWKKQSEVVKYFIQAYRNSKIHGEVCSTINDEYIFSDPKIGDLYQFEVWAENQFGWKGIPVKSENVFLPIGPPREVRVTRQQQSLILTWKSTERDLIYCIQVLSDGQDLVETCTSELKFDYANLIPTRTYYIKIWARSENGVKGEILTIGPCKFDDIKIRNVSTAMEFNKIAVSWTATAPDKVKEYLIHVLSKENGSSDKADESKFTTENNNFFFDDVVERKKYQFNISAVDGYGHLGGSVSSDWITADLGKPTVENLLLSVEAQEFIRAQWKAVKTQTYTVEVFSDGAKLGKPEQTTQGWYLFKAEKWKRYFVKVTARLDNGVEGEAVRSRTTMLPPGQVKGLNAEIVGDNLHLTWDAARGAAKYNVNLHVMNTKSSVHTSTIEETEINFPIQSSTQYFCTVRAENDHGESGEVTSWKYSTAPPLIEITETIYKDGNIVVKWKDLGEAVSNYKVLPYCNNEPQDIVLVDRRNSVFKLSNLRSKSKYSFKIWATNKFEMDGKEAFSIEIKTQIERPPKIENLSGKYVNEELTFTWKEIGGSVTYHAELFRFVKSQLTSIDRVQTSDARCSFPALFSQCYHLKVWAIDADDVKGEPAESKAIYTPPAPVQITQSVGNSEGLKVCWKENDLDLSISYNVQTFCNDEPQQVEKFFYGRAEYTLSHLQPKTRYYLEIWRTNNYGIDGEKSRSMQIVGGVSGPGRVANLQADPSENKVTISWHPLPETVCYVVRVCRVSPYKEVYGEETKTCEAHFPLRHSTQYFCHVRAKTEDGCEGVEASCSFATDLIRVKDIRHGFACDHAWYAWKKVQEHVKYHVLIYRNLGSREESMSKFSTLENKYYHEAPYSTFYRVVVQAESVDKKMSEPTEKEVPTPPPPVSITRLRQRSGKVVLKWEPIRETGITYSIVPFCNGKPQPQQNTSTHKFFLPTVQPTDKHHFHVWAVNRFGVEGEKTTTEEVSEISPLQKTAYNEDMRGSTSTLASGSSSSSRALQPKHASLLSPPSSVCDDQESVDSAPPPVRITRLHRRYGKIALRWEEIREPGITYRVLPFCNGEPQRQRITNTNKFTQKTVQSRDKHHFQVWAVNRFGVEGEKKTTVEVPERRTSLRISLFYNEHMRRSTPNLTSVGSTSSSRSMQPEHAPLPSPPSSVCLDQESVNSGRGSLPRNPPKV